MKIIIAIALGGSLGALTRYAISLLCSKYFGIHFPYGTLMANLIGCFVIGFIAFYFVGYYHLNSSWQAFLTIGYLGALTTFSTFSLQTLELIQDERLMAAVANISFNLIGSLIAVTLGMILAKILL